MPLRLDLRHEPVEETTELRSPLDRDAEATGEHVESATHRRLDGSRALRRDPDRRMRTLDRLREHGRLGNREELSLVAERLPTERFQDDVDGFFPAVAALLQLEAEALELVVLVAAAETDVDASAGQEIERRDLLGDDERMVQRNHDDRRADAQPRRLRRDVRRELHRAREIAVRREVMLGEPDVAKAKGLGLLRDVERARVDLRGRSRRRRLHEQEGSEFHVSLSES